MRTAYGDSWQTGTHFANYSTVRLQPVAYSASGLPEAKSFLDWKNFASAPYTSQTHGDRKSVVSGKSVSVRVDLGGRRIIKKQTRHNNNKPQQYKQSTQ